MATNAVVDISGSLATYYCTGVDSGFVASPRRIRHVIYQGIRIANVRKPMSNVDVVVHALKHVHDNLYKYRTTTHVVSTNGSTGVDNNNSNNNNNNTFYFI